MSVNLSLKQIQHSDIVADVRDALEESGLAPERLTLEITESVLMDDTELAVERLRDLKALGVTLALDDFGTGYSSLSYLSRFPVDILKMDRSFLHEGSTPGANSLANASSAWAPRSRWRSSRRASRRPSRPRRCARSDATSARASCSRGRWTPTTPWTSSPSGAPDRDAP